MDKNIESHEVGRRKERVLGKEFYPFDRSGGRVERKGNVEMGDAIISSKNVLNLTEKCLRIPIDIRMQSYSPGTSEVITPFTPGLKIIDRQFDPIAPFCLKIEANSSLLSKYGLHEKTDTPTREGPNEKFPTETLELLKRLRVNVQANGSSFEGKPGERHPLEYGALWFDFYHKEVEPHLSGVDEGTASKKARFILGFPDDPKRLEQISMRFDLADEQPQNILQPQGKF
jgi:hypothetical protein